ncbi:hypothetical protein J2S72_000573 [Peptoniphilus koenoeneniae]|uniref:DUF1700 domain-containing protein n=1 Tax=Peptoniphilus koenoeneniae TaxID=507751 RepID=A0ABU0ATG0_9FIRM|nr:hypothetical protein [Peptoniphilus koenoeneniae]MDQ0274556.1 hypothetical protein [Peptoniphilus koenoeneniae]
MYREFNEINTYIDNIFLGYPETQKNKNIKAELKKNMNLGMEEKIKISNREEDAFFEIINEFGDMSDLKEVLDNNFPQNISYDAREVENKKEKSFPFNLDNRQIVLLGLVSFFVLGEVASYAVSWFVLIALIVYFKKEKNKKSLKENKDEKNKLKD